jgi:hypothetical protein
MEINGKSKRTMWDGPSDPNKKLTTEFVGGKPRAVDDGVNYDADVIEETQALSDLNRVFNPEPEDAEEEEYKLGDIGKYLRDNPEARPDNIISWPTQRPTSMEMNGMELSKQSEGGWVGSPEKVDLLRKIGLAAAKKYPDQAIRIEPRDNQTQEVYTLSIRPKHLQRVDSVEKLRANNWVGIAGGSLSDLLAFCQKGLVVLLILLSLATSALAAPRYGGGYCPSYRPYSRPSTPRVTPRTAPKPLPRARSNSGISSSRPITSSPWFWLWLSGNNRSNSSDSKGEATKAEVEDKGMPGFTPADMNAKQLSAWISVVFGLPIICTGLVLWLRKRHEQRRTVLVVGGSHDSDSRSGSDSG